MKRIAAVSLMFCGVATAAAETPAAERIVAFPGAEGAGAYTVGGRFGSVYRVTNLNVDGPGSLADAVSQPNRIIVFTVSGIIDLGKKGKSGRIAVDQPNITIAGQTAPGEGICLKNGSLDIRSSDVIVRHLRSRRGFIEEGDTGDAFAVKPDKTDQPKVGAGTTPEQLQKVKEKKEERGRDFKEPGYTENILLDHLSTSWATDENLTLTHPDKTTAQFCIAAEGLDYANPKQTPPNHSEGSLWGVSWPDGRSTMHHMLYAHNRLRNPRTTGGSMPPAVLDFANSVVYDCSEQTSHTGSEAVYLNWRNNYYKPGPSTPKKLRDLMFLFSHSPESRMFAEGNIIDGTLAATADNWKAVRFEKGLNADSVKTIRVDKPFPTPQLRLQSAQEAYETVLAEAGATLPSRDSVDHRIVTQVRNRTGRVIGKETDLAPRDRWPDYRSLPAPTDSDADGMPDAWETQFGLDKSNASDAMKITAGGYANIEHYLNNTSPNGDSKPIVYAWASISRVDKKQPGEIRVARVGGDLGKPLEVTYRVEGTATAGKAYQGLSGKVTIPASSASAAIAVTPADLEAAAGKTLVIHLEAIPTTYNVGLPAASMVVFRQ